MQLAGDDSEGEASIVGGDTTTAAGKDKSIQDDVETGSDKSVGDDDMEVENDKNRADNDGQVSLQKFSVCIFVFSSDDTYAGHLFSLFICLSG